MARIMSADTAQEKYNKLQTPQEKLDYLLQQTFEANGLPQDLHSPIFWGHLKDQRLTMHALGTTELLVNPYSEQVNLFCSCNQLTHNYSDGDLFAFVVEAPSKFHPYSVFNVKHDTLVPLPVGYDSDPLGMLKYIIGKNFYHSSIVQIATIYEHLISTKLRPVNKKVSELQNCMKQIEEEQKKAETHLGEAQSYAEKRLSAIQERINTYQHTIANINELWQSLPDDLHVFCRAVTQRASNAIKDLPHEEHHDRITVELVNNRCKYEYPAGHVFHFLCALNTTQIITIHGKPGTGKTTFVTQMAKALGAKCTMIIVQNNWTDASDLMGYYNPINKSYHSTPFLEALIAANDELQAKGNSSRLHIICLDEMNLSRIEYYFATFLSLLQLDESERQIHLLPHDVEEKANKAEKGNEYEEFVDLKRYCSFKFPSNVRFVGTLNFDETATIPSPKVVDRSFYICFDDVRTSKLQKQKSIDTYFPLHLFDAECRKGQEITGRNARDTLYMQQMYQMARNLGHETVFRKLFNKQDISHTGRPTYEALKEYWESQVFVQIKE